MPIRVHVEWMVSRTMHEAIAIEAEAYEFPHTEDDFLRLLRERNSIGMVALSGGKVVGYVLYRLGTTGLHIVNLTVHPRFRRQSIGTQMIDKLIGKLSDGKRTELSATVRDHNDAGIRFLAAQGFYAVDVARGYFEDTGEDAYAFTYRLSDHPVNSIDLEVHNRATC